MLHPLFRWLHRRAERRRSTGRPAARYAMVGGNQAVESARFGKYDIPGAWRKAVKWGFLLLFAALLLWVIVVSLRAWSIFD